MFHAAKSYYKDVERLCQLLCYTLVLVNDNKKILYSYRGYMDMIWTQVLQNGTKEELSLHNANLMTLVSTVCPIAF